MACWDTTDRRTTTGCIKSKYVRFTSFPDSVKKQMFEVRLRTKFIITLLPKPGTVYPQSSRLLPVQRTLSNFSWRSGFAIRLLLRLLFQYFYYHHYHHRYHYRHHPYEHHYFMLCAIGNYTYCRRRNKNDCLHYTLNYIRKII